MSDPANFDTAEFWIPADLRIDAGGLGRRLVPEFAARSHVGLVREKNQDHFLISRMGRTLDVLMTSLPEGDVPPNPPERAYVMVIADGMGGMAAGERASKLAIQTGLRLVLESPKWALAVDDSESPLLIERLKEYFRKVDAALIQETVADPELTGMGTTLTVAYCVGPDIFLVHAGDSRAYLHRKGSLRQLTSDHNFPGRKNVLTNFVGVVPGIEPEISTARVQEGDCLLLCTDGLTNMVGDEEIAKILEAQTSPAQAAKELVERAIHHGGRDNVTVLLARYTAV